MADAKLFTIGFAGKNAEEFFTALTKAGVRKIIDIRRNNVSQLAGFTKKDDLRFFLEKISQCGYEHRLEWAPAQELLEGYRKKEFGWDEFEARFTAMIETRPLPGLTAPDLDRACLLCSESTPEHCHRRLVAEWLARKLDGLKIAHL